MNPHQTLVKETREWLEHAQADLDACTAPIAAGLAAEALFHAQQCAEKAIKAVLTWHQVSFRKTHDLDELREVCLPLAGDAGTHLAGIERLSQYAWRFRYPGARILPGEPRRKKPSRRLAGCWMRWLPGSNPSSAIEGL
jgi:HEPN domain-containing protein